ncbi:glycosyltransferase family 4 protein [Neorhizobium sp. JUb45]|uniref:glycosyltransferase family 4 protein n=1 Tax=unclassified Neorhizobium TaxID=2629175 RepID=UPI00104CAC96|nr:glycosyltransferase family 4 protein [Neorhizobium sp. JUb45]TCR00039.1 glycosyl transferase family 1 [Neorhizobium sp. JUb45]
MTDHKDNQPRVLQLVTHDKMGGVRTLVDMVTAGLEERGFIVESRGLRQGGAAETVRNMASLARDILKGRYQAILTYQIAASIYGNFFGWLARVPMRVSHHTASPEGLRPQWRAIDKLFGTIGVYTHMVMNSNATRDAFSSWPAAYRKHFIDIIHGVDPLPVSTGRSDWREKCKIPASATVLVATGRLVAQKDHATAVAALALLPGMHLIIAGDGPDQAALETRAQRLGVFDRLHLIGPVDRSELGDVLAAGNIYVFPSVWETFGLAGVEATMAGLPVVAADLAVLREVLSTGEPAGVQAMTRFHEVRNADELALAVQDLAAHYPSPEMRANYAEMQKERHGRARMLELYGEFLAPLKA